MRDTVVINVSYFLHFKDDPTVSDIQPNVQRAAAELFQLCQQAEQRQHPATKFALLRNAGLWIAFRQQGWRQVKTQSVVAFEPGRQGPLEITVTVGVKCFRITSPSYIIYSIE